MLLRALCFLVLAFWAIPSGMAATPNLVFIIADDCTSRDLGCYGGQAHTPHLNRLVEEGMKFTRCFQAAPMCSPTRHNIYTGLYPVRSGAYPNHTFANEGTKSVVHYLRPQGYRVHLSGKRHIAPPSVFPFEYSGKNNNPDMEAIDQLMTESKQSEKPFCLFACSNEPHTPWNKGDASQYDPAALKFPPYLPDTPYVREQFTHYLAEITYFDQQVGDILDLLKKHQLDDSTLVMVVSEQGNSLPFAKWTCYEAGVGSAMIVRWPGHVAPGSTTDAMVEYVDVLPTFLEAAGAPVPKVLEGKSFLPVLLGKTDQHKQWTYSLMTTNGIINGNDCYPIRSVRNEQYRLIWNLNAAVPFSNACTSSKEFESMLAAGRAGNQQAAEQTDRYLHRPEFELYDVQQDPFNMHNLADQPDLQNVRKEMFAQLQSWMKSQGDAGIETELEAGAHQKRGNQDEDETPAPTPKKKRAGKKKSS